MVVHRRSGGGRELRPAGNAKTARGALKSRRCGRRRITSSRASPASTTATRRRNCATSSSIVPRERLPPIEEADTFYHADLVGLDGVTPDGAQVGTVHAIHNFGAGDMIEIAPVGGGEPLMLPFNETTVPEIDLAAGRIVVVRAGRDRSDGTSDDVARQRTDDLSGDVSRAAGAEPCRQGARRRHLVARHDRHPRARDRQAPHRRRHAGRRRPRHGDEGRRAGARARRSSARHAPAPADEPARRAADAKPRRGPRSRASASSSSAPASKASTSA